MKIYLVGGAVRDKLLHLPIQERDYVVVGATVKDMLEMGYRQVGKEFPVFLHPKTSEEYALARMERKVKPGFKGFTFDTSSTVTLEEDLKRRDLTINAMAESPEGVLIDPYNGKADLANKILRHISPAFAEDPVRILRVGRFLARYAHLGFYIAEETKVLMRTIVKSGEIHALVAERVWKELERALAEKNPEKFFDALADCEALPILFPDLHPHGPGIAALMAATTLTPHPLIRFAALLHDYPEKTGSEQMGSEQMGSEQMGSEQMGSEQMGREQMGKEQTDSKQTDSKKAITSLCHRYRVPKVYHELAMLTAHYYHDGLQAKNFDAKQLLNFYIKLDAFRRERRFAQFLIATASIAHAKNLPFHVDHVEWLKQGAQIAKSVDLKQLIESGLSGKELVSAIILAREEKIRDWLHLNIQPCNGV